MNLLRTTTIAALLISGSQAFSASYDINFTRSTYEVQAGDSFSDLLAAHNAGLAISSQTLDGFDGIETQVQIAGNARDHSILMTTSFSITDNTQYEFQVGADWGRGGGIAIFDNDTGATVSEQIFTDDIWWGKNWNNSDVISTDYDFSPGNWTIAWIGFEGCCSGSTSIRFSENGGDFAAFTALNFQPGLNSTSEVPLPGAAYLFGSALAGLFMRRRKNRA